MRMKFDMCWVDGFQSEHELCWSFLQTICVVFPVSCIRRCSIAFLHNGGCDSRIGMRCFPEHVCEVFFCTWLALMIVAFVLLQAEWLRNLAQRQQQLHQQQHMLQQQHAVAEAAYVNVSAKRMGNGATPIPGIPGMGMAGPMGTSMGPNIPGAVVGGGLAMGFGGPMVPGMAGNRALTPNTPPSPDSDGGQNGLSLSPMQYGMDGSLRGRKRGPDGPVEKVVERRQRRMIKNRESAARSRARKQVRQSYNFMKGVGRMDLH